MEKQKLIKLIDVAAGRKKADLVLKNAKIVDVFQAKILTGDIAISDGYIAGIGESYQGVEERNYTGKYVAPGFIEAHIHIESSYVSPEEFSRVFIPRGTTTIRFRLYGKCCKERKDGCSLHDATMCSSN